MVPGVLALKEVTLKQQPQARPLTIVYPYYENPYTLARHVQLWQSWTGLLPYLRFIIVDDGSPNSPAEPVLKDIKNLDLRLFRIDIDIRWNWIAAKNIGMHYAEDGWCITTDIDHFIPVSTATAVVYGDPTPDTIYFFSRRNAVGGEKINPHPNSFLWERSTFWDKFGGYDERLSGYYGTDGHARRRMAQATQMAILTHSLIRDEHNGDSSTTKYLRKQPMDAAVSKILAQVPKPYKPTTMTFKHREISLT